MIGYKYHSKGYYLFRIFIINTIITWWYEMRLLLIHSDYIKYKTKSKTKIAEEITDEKKEGEFKNSLVVFTAVEKER